ncbi:uncharacterized protein LOC132545512 [Ylistrum balloti]|uniref:uncharacterized protein LOC132545512 n=1 Tax=Ylistrum balloti TaxID=509963 RepID=UPI002905917D|nr:uncharacterized protein LOC132545512 [Ylistrum balloti]
MISWTLSVFLALCLSVGGVDGGECCKAHYGLLSMANDEMWCDDYCCHNVLRSYYCCDDFALQASSWEREDVCPDFYAQNVWVPILISLGCLASIIGCGVCCWCCCCRSSSRVGGAVIMAPANPGVTVVNTNVTNNHQQVPAMTVGNPNTSVNPYNNG